MSFVIGVLALAVVTSLACALPGVFVVLRRDSMLVDGISHAILPGIVVGYALTGNPDSPLLLIGAALSGLVVVLASHYLTRTGLLTGDAPQGLLFPALFSVGIIWLSRDFSDLHLDVHVVLVGDPNLAALRQWTVAGVDLGPVQLWTMLAVLAAGAAFCWFLYPRLEVSTFDPAFARSLGLRAGLVDVGFMLLVAVTVTAAFNTAGAILVIALVTAPAAAALLLARTLPGMIAWALSLSALGSVVGFVAAYWLGAPTSAGMAVVHGLVFTAVFVLRRGRQRSGRGPETQTASVAERPSEMAGPFATLTATASDHGVPGATSTSAP